MKKILALVAVGLAGVAFAPPAGADIQDYFSHLSDAGFNVTVSIQPQVLSLGEAVCIDMYNGYPLRKEMADAMGMGFTQAQAAQFISISIADLCPQASGRINTGEV